MIAGTLGGASGQSVDTLLDRVGSRRQRALAAKVGPSVLVLVLAHDQQLTDQRVMSGILLPCRG